MTRVDVAEAKDRLSELIARAAAGEAVQITEGGKPVARIVAGPAHMPAKPRQRMTLEELEAATKNMPWQEESAGDFVRRMRDEDRY